MRSLIHELTKIVVPFIFFFNVHMKTFKKLFAYSAIFALLATMMPTYANAASYSDELTEAYGYAKNKWITTMASIDDADMYGNLTRVAMAKMVANYVLDLGLQELDTTKECKFPDVSVALDTAYDNGVTKACQLGLMGVGITKFNPNGIVTRAEFGTVLSRALWGDENNGGDPYYKKHLQALKDEGIMNMIDNPNMKEVRGYVMLMMMRADDSYAPAVGCSAEELLTCILADDYEACIAACSDEATEVLPGFVTISKVSVPAQQDVPKNAVNVNIGRIKLTAGENGARVSSLEISRDGLADMSDPENRPQVYVQGGNIKTTAKPVSSSTNKVIVKFSPALDLKAGSSMEFDVMMSMDPAANAVNSTHNFKVSAVNVANGTASGTPLTLGTVKTTSANTKNVTFNVKQGDSTAKAGENKILAKVEIIFDHAWTLRGFSLGAATAPAENLYDIFANAEAYIDGAVVGGVSLSKDKVIVSGLNTAKAKDEKVIVEIKADVVYSKEIVDIDFEYDNVDVLEGNSGFGMNATAGGLAEIEVHGSDISFKKLAIEKNVLPGTSQVKLFAGELKTATDLTVQKVKITPTLNTVGAFGELYSSGSAVFKINGEEFEIADADIKAGAPFAISATDMEVGIDAGTTAKIEIIINTRVPAPLTGATVQFEVELVTVENMDDHTITYAVPARKGDAVSIKAGDIKLNKATIAWPATESLFANKEQEVGRFSIKANNDTAVLKDFDLENQGSLSATDFETLFDGNLTLFKIDSDTATEVNANITFNDAKDIFEVRNMSVEIPKNKTVNFKLMASLGTIKDYHGSGVLFNITTGSVRATSSVVELTNDAPQKLSTNPYTFRATRPDITLTKHAYNMFKVVIKNVDDDVDINVKDLKFRVRSLTKDSDFDGEVCLTDDVNQLECNLGSPNFWKRNTGLTNTGTIFNNDELINYILIDGESIEPEILQAQIASLDYNETWKDLFPEKYNVVAQ